MGQKLPPKQNELYRRCDEVLHYIWDPIGVSDYPEARDEYQSYLPEVFARLVEGTNAESLKEHLDSITRSRIGLTVHGRTSQTAAEALVRWAEILLSEDP